MPHKNGSPGVDFPIERAVLSSSPSFIFAMDRAGNFLYATPSVAKAFNLTQEFIVGRAWNELGLDPEAMAQINADREKVLTIERTIHADIWSPTLQKYLQYEASPLREDGQTTGVVFSMTDASALRLSEEKFSKAFHGTVAAKAIVRLKDGMVLDANNRWLGLNGLTREEAVGHTTLELGLWADPNDRKEFADELELKDSFHDKEFNFRRKNDGVWTAQMSAQVIDLGGEKTIISSLIDISQRKRAEEALKESEERFRSTLDTMLEGCQIIGRDWRYIYINDAAERHNRRPKEELIGKRYQDMWPGIESTKVFAALKQCMEERTPQDMENEFVFPDERRGWFDLRISPVPEGIFILSSDITSRKKVEETLRWRQKRDELLADVTGKLLSSIDPQSLIDDLAKRTMEFLDCDVFFNYLVDEKNGGISLNAYSGVPEEEAAKMRHLDLGAAVCGRVAQGGKRIIVRDIMTNEDERTPFLKAQEVQAYACHPLLAEGRVIGTLSFGTKSRSRFSDEEISVMKDVSDYISMALRRLMENKTLAESEERYRGLFDSMTEYLQVLELVYDEDGSPIDYYLVDVNPAWERLTGLKRECVIGHRGKELFGVVEDSWLEAFDAVVKTGKSISFESYGAALDKYYTISAWKMGETQVAFTSMDITDVKKAQHRVEEERERLLSLINSMSDEVWLANAQGRVIMVNPAVAREFHLDLPASGEDIERVAGSYEVFRSDGSPRPPKEAPPTRALRGERVINEEEIVRTPATGELRNRQVSASPIRDSEGKIIGSVSVVRDITEVKQREKELEQERARLQAVLEAAPFGIFIGDEKGKGVLINSAFYRIWGESAPTPGSVEEYREYKGWFVDSGEEVKAEEWASARALRGESVSDIVDIQRFDGRRGTILISAVPLRDADDSIRGSIMAIQDITKMRQTEENLRRSNEELRQFAYVASHDLQEPLRMVTSYLGLIEKRYGNQLDDTAKEYMSFVLKGSERMRQLISDLLEYSRVDTRGKQFSPVDMNEVVEKTLFTLKPAIDENHVTIEVRQLPTITADESQMIQLLQNLIGNAIKFRGKEAPKIAVSSSEGRRFWTFAVQDNGIGISPEYKERIFEVFTRLHSSEKYLGTGIGLAICKKIVERHGGRIWVESEEGKGSTFHFSIPKEA